jgi:hypothetical protein
LKRHGLFDPAPTLCNPAQMRLPVRRPTAVFLLDSVVQQTLFFRFRQSFLEHGRLGPRSYRSFLFMVAGHEKTKLGVLNRIDKLAYLG